MDLRPYQQEAIAHLRMGFSCHQRQILCMPTGAGKTVVFSEIASLSAQKDKRVCILTDRIELLEQASASLFAKGVRPYFLTAGQLAPYGSKIVVGMVETVSRRISRGWTWKPDLIIIDEAHRGNFSKVIEAWNHAKVIGATATPVGKHFYKYYTNIINPIQIPQLIEQGYLSPYRAIQVQDDISDLRVRNGEFTPESLNSHFNKPKRFAGVVEHYRQHANNTKAIVFNVSIEHSDNTARAFRDAGYTSESVTSATDPAERKRILAAFRDGHIQVINNCGILTTGYDEPSIETVIMNRATMSLPLWLQCCGRGSRIYPGKEYFTVIDLGMNHERLGWWDDVRVWRIEEPKKRKQRKDSAPPSKRCPKCDAILHASLKICTFCGHKFEDENMPVGVGVELHKNSPPHLIGKKISELSIPELIDMQKSNNYRKAWVWRILRHRGEHDLREYAKIEGYKSGWVRQQLRLKRPKETFNDYIITR